MLITSYPDHKNKSRSPEAPATSVNLSELTDRAVGNWKRSWCKMKAILIRMERNSQSWQRRGQTPPQYHHHILKRSYHEFWCHMPECPEVRRIPLPYSQLVTFWHFASIPSTECKYKSITNNLLYSKLVLYGCTIQFMYGRERNYCSLNPKMLELHH